jgi:hypothetical protein
MAIWLEHQMVIQMGGLVPTLSPETGWTMASEMGWTMASEMGSSIIFGG